MLAAVLQSVVLASRSIDLASGYQLGELSNIIIRPISNLWYWLSRDAADKALNLIFSAVEIFCWLFYYVRHWPGLTLPHSAISLLLILPLSTLLYYFINYLFGLTGFWTNEVWAPRFLLMVVLQFLAGLMFPLDVLPQKSRVWPCGRLFRIWFIFLAQVILGKTGNMGIINGLAATAVWTIIFGILVEMVWRKGLRVYGAEGR